MNDERNALRENVVVMSSDIDSNKRLYRVSCVVCRAAHRKCDRELPSCGRCVRHGLTCKYQPPKNRGRSRSSANQNTEEHTNLNGPIESRIQQNNMISLEIQPRFKIYQPIAYTAEDKVNSAEWFSTRAVFFLQAQNAKDHPAEARRICNDASNQLSKITPGVNANDLYDIIQSMSKLELQENAVTMFSKGKEVVLFPDIFPLIANNAILASACASLSTYSLLNQNQNIPESLLFNSAVKVFVKQFQSARDSESSTALVSSDDNAVNQYRRTVHQVTLRFYSVKLMQFFYSDISKYTMNDLLDVFKYLLRISEYLLQLDPLTAVEQSQSINVWNSMIQIINNNRGLKRTKLLLNALEMLLSESNVAYSHETSTALVRGLQLTATTSELNMLNDSNEYLELKALQLKHSSVITAIATKYSILSEFIANGSKILVHACEIHIEYCDNLLSSENFDAMELSGALTILQSNAAIMNQFQNKYPLPLYERIVQQTNNRILAVLNKLQAIYNNKQEQASIAGLESFLSNQPQSNPSINNTMEILSPLLEDLQEQQHYVDLDDFFNFDI
jgi:hypothetical protein